MPKKKFPLFSLSAWQDSSAIVKGIIFILLFCFFAPIMDTVAKYLSLNGVPVLQVVWARFFTHMFFAIPIAYGYHKSALMRPSSYKMQISRSILLMFATLCFFSGLKFMSIADALALAFICPFIVTAASGLFLGEKVGVYRWSAVFIGFAGIIIILRPGAGVFSYYALLPLATGVLYAFYVLLTRKMAGKDPPLVTLAYTAITGAVIMTAVLAVSGQWVIPQGMNFLLLCSVGAWAMVSHFCLIKAYENAPASSLAPFMYCEIIMATILGYIFFGDFPDIYTWVGMSVVVSSGIFISYREHMRRRKTK